jgi:tetrahydrodipicolinate N-acetyltransferase
MKTMDANEIISFIQNSVKKTPVKIYLKGRLATINFGHEAKTFINGDTGVVFGEWKELKIILDQNKGAIDDYVVENDRRNSALPMLDTKGIKARIEPGAIIRDQVEIGDNAVIMMGAVINIGSVIGEGTMIDMNVVLGGRATVGKNCHIGAGTVLAGVIEPPSAKPVTIEDDVVIGANAVVLEGVRVGKGAVVAAGAVVIDDVPPYTVVAGMPAKVIKKIDEKTKSKTEIKQELRQLNKEE